MKHGGTEAFIKVGELFGFTAGSFYYELILEPDSFVEMVKGSVKLNSKFCCGEVMWNSSYDLMACSSQNTEVFVSA